MHVVWLFEITTQDTTYYWGTSDYTYDGNNYQAMIDSRSFSGIKMQGESDQMGLINPTDLSFKVISATQVIEDFEDATGETITDAAPFFESQFNGVPCILYLILDDVLQRSWRFRVRRANMAYGQAEFCLTSLLSSFLEGYHPNTPHPREIWPSDDPEKDPDDNYIIPQAFGDAYIPLRSVNTGSERYYVIGNDANTYTISKVESPKEWGNWSEWTSSSYSFNQSTDSGYQLMQAIIADSDGDGIADANGLWKGGQFFLDMPTRFTSDEISASADVNPADVIEQVIKDMGVDASYIDTGTGSTFESAASQFSTWGIYWNGGFYKQKSREKRLASLQVQSASSIQITDKVELHPRSTTVQATLTKSQVKNFDYRPVWPKEQDGGHIKWVPLGTPQDQPQEAVVWSNSTQSDASDVTDPASENLDVSLVKGSDKAKRLGVLYFNRRLDKNGVSTFTTIPNKSLISLKPTDIITLDSELYGETRNVLIRSIKFNKDLSLELECIEFKNGVLGFDDVVASEETVVTDTSEAWEEPTTSGSPNIGIKINTKNFSTSSDGVAYIHGFNVHGEKVDKNGKISWGGEEYTVPRDESGTGWTLTTSQEYEGYIVFDTTKSGKFTDSSGNAHSVAFVKRESNTWYYDDGAAWQSITLSTTDDVIIGEITRGSTAIDSATVWYSAQNNGLITNQDINEIALEATGWSFDGTFSSSDVDTVAWTSGTFTLADGTTYSINSGNTGNMGSKTYIYFDRNVSETDFQTTTSISDSVGQKKTLVAVAQNDSDGAWYFFMKGGQQRLTAGFIAAGTITADLIAANTLTSSEINTGSITITEWDQAGNLSKNDTADFDTEVSGTEKPENNATVGADWASNISNMPDGAGILDDNNNVSAYSLAITADHIGYYGYNDATSSYEWTAYIDSNGYFRFRGDNNNEIEWDGTTLNVIGSIAVQNPSGVRTDINVEDGADVTNNNTANDTDNVNGTSASTVEDGASRANSGLNSSGELFNVAAPTTNAGTPSSSGLYLGADALGYFDGGSWTAYIDDSGHFYFTGDSNNFVQWDGSNLTWSGNNASLNSSGNLVVSTIEITSLEDGADVTSNHSQDLNWITDSGSLTISSGSITISASETFTISADEGMVIATGGGIKFKGHDSSSALLKFVGATDPDYIYKFGANDSCTLCCMWSEDSIGGGSSTTDLYFGYSVADTFSNTENLPFYRVRINASYSIDFDGVAIAHDDLKPYSNAAYDNGTNSNAWNYIWGNILGLLTQSSEPSDPPYSSGVQWIDDGTLDTEGALLYKYTDSGGTTTTYKTNFTAL